MEDLGGENKFDLDVVVVGVGQDSLLLKFSMRACCSAAHLQLLFVIPRDLTSGLASDLNLKEAKCCPALLFSAKGACWLLGRMGMLS